MKHLIKIFRTTLIGGFLVLFPLFGCLYFIVFIGGLMTSSIKPFLSFVPDNEIAALPYADLLSVFLLIVLCFLIGIAIRTSLGRALASHISQTLNTSLLYRVFNRAGKIFFDPVDPRGIPVLVSEGESKVFGFLIEQINDHEAVVLFPEVPRPFYGNIKIVKAERIERLGVESSDLVRVLIAYGIGTTALLAKTAVKREVPATAAPVQSS